MRIVKWMRKENSGLARTTLEMAKYEDRLGHAVAIREPGSESPLWGTVTDPDVHTVHSQLHVGAYHDRKPKFMVMHGEPLSSVGNGISMKAICDLAYRIDAFLCMRKEEVGVWSQIKRTYLVPKGVDLEVFKPLDGITERLKGEPAILYVENWRGQRNPLYLCMAMQRVYEAFPKARLHLYNCQDPRMLETFKALHKVSGWQWLSSLMGPVDGGEAINLLYNRVDMVVSCLYPLYARGIEALAAGRAFLSAGYQESGYPWTVPEYSPEAFADTIIRCWEDYDKINYREWAQEHHDAAETARQSVEIYKRYT